MWTEQNATWVFYYKEIAKLEGCALNGDNMPFSIGIQTKWQMKMMLNHGHMSGVALDATLGTNDKKNKFTFFYPLEHSFPQHLFHSWIVGYVTTLDVKHGWKTPLHIA